MPEPVFTALPTPPPRTAASTPSRTPTIPETSVASRAMDAVRQAGGHVGGDVPAVDQRFAEVEAHELTEERGTAR